MCGFAGIFNAKLLMDSEVVNDIARKVSFRGPDHCGIRIYDSKLKADSRGNNVLFFNRLSIIDTHERANQPFEDERYSMVFNGEIYNYKELKTELEKEGALFRTTSDTEVLFFALKLWGINSLIRLNGMFSFVWLDRKERCFILARDRVGIKPLYFSQLDQSLLFASELDSIIRLSKFNFKLSQDAVKLYLLLQFVPTPHTIVDGIHKLPPGHYIQGTFEDLLGKKELTTEPYWDAYEYVLTTESSSGYGDNDVESLLIKSLQMQLNADVPIGLFLSSGVDSSLLASIVNKYFAAERTFRFFTIGFKESTTLDESDEASKFIRGFNNSNLQHQRIALDPSNVKGVLDSLYDYYDEPFGDSASLLNLIISKKAREYVKVIISGDGADELFWGYPRYNLWQRNSNQIYNRHLFLITFFNLIKKCLPSSRITTRIIMKTEHDPVKMHFNLFLPLAFYFITKFLRNPDLWYMKNVAGINNRDDLIALLDFKTYLPDVMLYKVDRSSMAASLEVRVPYLDNHVVDYSLRTSLDKKSNTRFRNKALLKDLLLKVAPHYDVYRSKKGFSFPLRKWLLTDWKEQVLSLVNRQSLEDVGLDARLFIKPVNDFYNKNVDNTFAVWHLLNLLLWHDKYKKMLAEA